MDYSIKPILKWPGVATNSWERKRGDFSPTYAKTLGHLERELAYLGADHVIFQLAVDSSAIRMDGRLRSDARPEHPGIIVTFHSDKGPMSYFCDKYDDWKANLRAISITLQNLRRIDDHGVNGSGAQYEGYKQLPPRPENGQQRMSRTEAAAFISDVTGVREDFIVDDSATFELAYSKAQRSLHPDAGGDHDKFVKLQDAAAVLRESFK
jgi:hypothetical protein